MPGRLANAWTTCVAGLRRKARRWNRDVRQPRKAAGAARPRIWRCPVGGGYRPRRRRVRRRRQAYLGDHRQLMAGFAVAQAREGQFLEPDGPGAWDAAPTSFVGAVQAAWEDGLKTRNTG